ncbi:MAG: bifunctional UDP-sugar hydrolase/5'-nucleotidase [Bacteroidales bacterium]
MNRIFSLLLLGSFLLASSCIYGQDLVILHTNDVHSNIEPLKSGRNAGNGGFQRRANYIKTVRDSHPNVLLLDAGDYNQGTPYYTLFKGEMEVMLYNAMGYDAVSLGNHEFDDGQEALAKRLQKADYKTLCANYDFDDTPLEGIIEPYTIIHKGGKKIGIIGALLDLNGYVSAKAIEGLEYNNPVRIVNKLAKMLKKKENCDLVIVLSHLGYSSRRKDGPGDLELAQASRNVDLVLGGHSHTFLEEPTVVKNKEGKEVIVNQTGALGVYVGRIDINF